MTTVEDVVLSNVKEIFCSNPQYFNDLNKIINSTSDVSSRLVEYFVTQHSKEEPFIYQDGQGNTLNLYQAYAMQLKAYGKRLFDPFRRGSNKFDFFCELDGCETKVNTTVGQLFFYAWFFKTGAMEYLSRPDVRERVIAKMLTSYKDSGMSDIGKKKRVSPKKGCVMPPSNLLVF